MDDERNVPAAATPELGEAAACRARRGDGHACRMRPLNGGEHCWSHDPDRAAEAAAARRRGGLHRRRARDLRQAYDIKGVRTLNDIARVVEIGLTETLELANSVARSRALFAGCAVLLRLFELGEIDDRLAALDAAFRPSPRRRQ